MGRSLVLAAHGSNAHPQVNAGVIRLAKKLQDGQTFDRVIAAFHQGEPRFRDALGQLPPGRVVIVPFMTSRGYYCDEVLPREVRRSDRFCADSVRITNPVGAHPRMETLIADRIQALAHAHALRESGLTVVLVGHGAPRCQQSRQITESLTARLRSRFRHAVLHSAFIDDDPSLDTVLEGAMEGDLIVIPFFMSAGWHTQVDLPNALGFDVVDGDVARCRTVGRRRVVLDHPVGHDPQIAGFIEDLAMLQERPGRIHPAVHGGIRLGTRSSRMAIWQAEHVAGLLAPKSDVGVVRISTSGDRDQSCPIERLPSSAPFTDDIDTALVEGRIDLAVHSLKDLPLDLTSEFRIAAVLPRSDARECIVTCDGVSLAALDSQATVGTSSARRAAQVRRLRSDLRVVPLRGPVDDRVRQVHAGKLDAAVLAVAGLERLGLLPEASEVFELEEFLPAPGQAALAVVVRSSDARMFDLVHRMDHIGTRICTQLERDVQRALENNPETWVAAFADLDDAELHLRVRIMDRTSGKVRDVHVCGDSADEVLASALADLKYAFATGNKELVR